jgi:hypothetical protein
MSHEGWAVRGYIEWWMAILYLVLISKAGCTLPLHAAESFKSLVSMLSYVQFAREHMICFESSVVPRRNMAYHSLCFKRESSASTHGYTNGPACSYTHASYWIVEMPLMAAG